MLTENNHSGGLIMNRSKRVVFVAHCLLNSNAKVVGYAEEPGVFTRELQPYINQGVGIVQLPCPEITFLGINRWGMTQDQYDTPSYRRHCQQLLTPIVDQIELYLRFGYTVEGILGIEGSPSCGVGYTFVGYQGGRIQCLLESPEAANSIAQSEQKNIKGIYIDELAKLLEARKIVAPIIGIEEER